MDQIANLVIDLSIDAAAFKNEVPRIRKLLSDASGESERAAARVQRFADSQKKAAQAATAGAEKTASAMVRQRQSAMLAARSYAEMAQRVDMTRRHVAALGEKLRDQQARAASLAGAQDRATAAFYRQIDGVKSLERGLTDLQRIQGQVREARRRGDISQQDHLALVSAVTARTRTLRDAEAASTRQKTQFIQRLKAQVATQNLSSAALLRHRAAQLGVSSAADVYIRKLEGAGRVTRSLGLKSAAARRELGVMAGQLMRGNLGALRGSGMTLANRAGWLSMLMSPKGLAVGGVVGGIAAAVYGLGRAWHEGRQESVEFNKQLILTGRYAGKTAGQLQALARSISGNGVTQGDAAGVLAKVVGSGAFSGNDTSRVANVAARLQQATGQAVEETIGQFKRLKDDPVNAVVALNDSLHFLTAAQYEQIAAAQATGDAQRAAELAMRAYSEAVIRRAGAVQDNLGTLEKAWNWVKHAASGAWDAMLGVGRNPDTALKRQNVFAEWQAAEREYRTLSRNLNVDPDYAGNNVLQKADAERLRNARRQVALKKQAYDLADQAYAQEGLAAAREKMKSDQQSQAVRRQQRFNQLVTSGLTVADRRAEAEKKLNQLIQKNRQDAKDGIATRWSDRDIAAARVGIKKAFRDVKTPGNRNDEATRLLLQYSQQQAQVEGQIAAAKRSSGAASDRMTAAGRQLLALRQRLSDLSGKTLTADEKSVLARRDELVSALRGLDAKQQALMRQGALNDLLKKTVQLTSQLGQEARSQRQQHDATIATAGMGDAQRRRYEEDLKLRQKFAQQQEQLERDSRQKGTYGSAEYGEAERALRDSLGVQLDENRRYWQQLDVAQGDWQNGASRALQNYTADAGNVAKMTEQMFTTAFNGMGEGLATFVTTGRLNFKAFTASLLSDLAKIAARMAMMQAVKGAFDAMGWDWSKFVANADGGVYRSASLSRHSGTVVDRPTFFAFAKGAGVMGEAGPEAILPLRRGADGKLGVVASGGGGMVYAPQLDITINNDGQNGQIGPQALKAVYDVSKKAALDVLSQQRRDGGQLA